MKANVLCFDAETYKATDDAALAWLERTCPKNKKLETHIADSATNPMVANILCICLKLDGGAEFGFDMMAKPKAKELQMFVDVVNDNIDEQTVFTGYNVKHFDLPLILMELQRAGITPPEHWPVYNGRYWRGRIHDSMERMPGSKSPRMGEACAMYGIPGKQFIHNGKHITGADVGGLFDDGEYAAIVDYCFTDVQEEYELYLKQTFGGQWGTYDDYNTDLREILGEINKSSLSDSAKWLSAASALKASRLLTA